MIFSPPASRNFACLLACTAAQAATPSGTGPGTACSFLHGEGPPAILDVRLPDGPHRAWRLFELQVQLRAAYQNPFDPDEVALAAEFATPGGRRETVPGFFYGGFRRSRAEDGREVVTATGQYGWRIRYLPRTAGQFQCTIVLRNSGRTLRSAPVRFQVEPGNADGFIRVSRRQPLYFEYDSGKPYFAVGENVCWPGKGGTYDYDHYWARLAENHANYARIWVGPFDCFTLERPARGRDDPAGLGRIDLAAAWRLDTVLHGAARHGIHVMFCIDSFNSLRIRPMYPRWAECPYNAANGGPLKKPEEFFTNPEAQKLYRRRLRYIVARWAWDPTVLSWEFWNEVDIIEKYRKKDVAAWHREMAHYLRRIDPWDHMITTSFARTFGDPLVDALPELDYVQSHQYGAVDIAEAVRRVCLRKAEKYGKPHYFGEFGTDWKARGTQADSDGIHLHNGLWSAVVSRAAGTSMLWWWDNYVDPHNLYYHFKPVADFVKAIPFNRVSYGLPGKITVAWANPTAPRPSQTLYLVGRHATWKAAPWNRPNRIVVEPNGRVDGADRLSRILHGLRNHPDLHNPVVFLVDYPKPGRFSVRVTAVSGYGGATLDISVDGKVLLHKDFQDTSPKSTGTMHKYDGLYTVNVPAGNHEIRVENRGADWVFVEYRFHDYQRMRHPPLRIWGLTASEAIPAGAGPTAFFWVQNEGNTWFRHNQGDTLSEVSPARITLRGIPDGAYRLEWFDTYKGGVVRAGEVRSAEGKMELCTPPILRDIAFRIFRAGGENEKGVPR